MCPYMFRFDPRYPGSGEAGDARAASHCVWRRSESETIIFQNLCNFRRIYPNCTALLPCITDRFVLIAVSTLCLPLFCRRQAVIFLCHYFWLGDYENYFLSIRDIVRRWQMTLVIHPLAIWTLRSYQNTSLVMRSVASTAQSREQSAFTFCWAQCYHSKHSAHQY